MPLVRTRGLVNPETCTVLGHEPVFDNFTLFIGGVLSIGGASVATQAGRPVGPATLGLGLIGVAAMGLGAWREALKRSGACNGQR